MKIKTLLSTLLSMLLFTALCQAQTGYWQQMNPENSPPPRCSFGITDIGDEKVIIFGGVNYIEFLNDTWIYDYKTNNWTEVTSEPKPSKRSGHSLARLTKNKVLLFGGEHPFDIITPGYKDDTWIFDLDSNKWFEMNPSKKPSPRESFALAQLEENKALLYSGNDTSGAYQWDAWIYNLDNNLWVRNKHNLLDPNPFAGEAFQIAMLDTGKVLLYGGWQYKLLDENWIFDLQIQDDHKKWQKITPKNNTNPLASSMMANIGKNMILLFGGDDEKTSHNYNRETWIFNFKDTSWKLITTLEPLPLDRYIHGMAKIFDNKVLLFGGINRVMRYCSDTWIFTLNETNIEEEKHYKNYFLINDNILIVKNIENLEQINKIVCYNIIGEIVKEFNSKDFIISGSEININISGLNRGIYFINFISPKKNTIIKFIY